MHISMGMDRKVLVRDAMAATTLALAFSSSEASTMPRFSSGSARSPDVEQHDGAQPCAGADNDCAAAQHEALPIPMPITSSAAAPVNQVSNAAQRNHSNARGATYCR